MSVEFSTFTVDVTAPTVTLVDARIQGQRQQTINGTTFFNELANGATYNVFQSMNATTAPFMFIDMEVFGNGADNIIDQVTFESEVTQPDGTDTPDFDNSRYDDYQLGFDNGLYDPADLASLSTETTINDDPVQFFMDLGAGNDVGLGGTLNDRLIGGSLEVDGDDLIFGRDGEDYITGGAGNDELFGNANDDDIEGNAGLDSIFGGDGEDEITGGADDDFISGGDDSDNIFGDGGNDEIEGNDGDDFISGGLGNDLIRGGDGDDEINGDEGNDTIDGNAGDDDIFGGTGNDVIAGGSGSDEIDGQDGNDRVGGGLGDDFILGSAGNDVLAGNQDDDTIDGGADNDFVLGNLGNDSLFGGDGNDDVRGGEGNDDLLGGNGNDILRGGPGNDRLDGGFGDDLIAGNANDDVICFSTDERGFFGVDQVFGFDVFGNLELPVVTPPGENLEPTPIFDIPPLGDNGGNLANLNGDTLDFSGFTQDMSSSGADQVDVIEYTARNDDTIRLDAYDVNGDSFELRGSVIVRGEDVGIVLGQQTAADDQTGPILFAGEYVDDITIALSGDDDFEPDEDLDSDQPGDNTDPGLDDNPLGSFDTDVG